MDGSDRNRHHEWFREVVHGGTQFIAIAYDGENRASKIVRSADGTTWNEAGDTDTVNRPLLLFFAQMCVNHKRSKVSGLP